MNTYENLELGDLIMRCRDCDDSAFSELVRRYKPMVKSVVASFTEASVGADELCAEAYVALHSAALRYDLGQNKVTFGLFARICVYNRLVDTLRRADALPELCEVDVDTLADEGELESGIVARDTLERVLRGARELLSDLEYTVLMYHIQGYKTSAIAEALGRSPKSVDNAKWRIFKRLRAELAVDGDS